VNESCTKKENYIRQESKQNVALCRSAHGLLSFREHASGKEIPVKPHLCFPWTSSKQYISLRNDEGKEIMFIEDLKRLDPASRELLENALAEVGFILEITQIHSIREDFELRNWKVETLQGPRTFQTKLDNWPRPLPKGGILIKDIAEDLLYIPDPSKLDAKSQKILWAFLD